MPSRIVFETLTVELARKLCAATDARFCGRGQLSNGPLETRRINYDLIDGLAAKLTAGEWTGITTITVDTRDLSIVDGYYRACAVLRSGVAVPCRLVPYP